LRFDVFPVASFTQFPAFYNFGAATAAASPLIFVALLGLLVEQRVLRGRVFQFRWGGLKDPGTIALGQGSVFIGALATLTAGVLVIGPLGALLWRGLNAAALSEAIDRAGGSALRSLVYSGVSATVLSALGFFLAYLIHRRAVPGWCSIDALSLFLFTLPGAVIGIGLILLWNHPHTNWIYATPAIVAIGYTAQYAALSTRTILAGFSQQSPSLEEAAEIAGARWFNRVGKILVPLQWRAILASWVVTFLFCLRDVSIPLLLAPPGRDTLTARTMTLMANGSPELIAALCLLSIVLTLVPLVVLGAASGFWSKAA
jgi:iron(III) transport system permease protein